MSHTNFSARPFVGGGMAAGVGIGSLLLAGFENYAAACEEHRRRERLRLREKSRKFNAAAVDYLNLRLNAEIDTVRTQALVIAAQAKTIERLGGR